MDLRSSNLTSDQLAEAKKHVIQTNLAYQPFIITDDLEVGKGMQMFMADSTLPLVYWKDKDLDFKGTIAEDKEFFRECNQIYREIYYEYQLDTLVEMLGNDISDMTFAEVGCNSGYFMHGLSLRGAKEATGYDIPNNSGLFDWFNRVLEVNSKFKMAEWSSIEHKLNNLEMEEVDVVLTMVVLCHLSDPLYHLAYLCDHAKKAILVYTTIRDEDDLSIKYGQPPRRHLLDWPINLDLEVMPSLPLVKLALAEGGFEDIHEIECPNLPPEWKKFTYNKKIYLAFRTKDVKTAVTTGRRLRKPKSMESKLIEAYRGYNIISCNDKFYGLAQGAGRLDMDKVGRQGYPCVVGNSVNNVKGRIDEMVGRKGND